MKKLFTVRNIIITLSVLLFLFIAAQKAGIISNDHKTKVITDTVTTRNITETVSGSGKIQPVTQVKISSDVSGEITEMLVKEGDMVHKGDLLCRIKQDIYLSNLERMEATVNSSKAGSAQSKARLAQSKAQLINSENLYKRNQKLFDSGVLSQQDFDAAKAQYETAKAEVEAAHEALEAANYNISNAEAGLREAQNNLSRTSIYSPVDGKVSKLNVEKGERVVGTAQMTGTEIMTIANLNEMEVRVDINENDIIHIKINDTAHIEVDAYFDKKFKGIVTEISNSANITGMNTDQVTNFTVNIRILQESYKHLIPPNMPDYSPFRPGMSASVDIETNRVSKVLSIPVEAVTTRNDTSAYGSTKSKRKALSENKKQNKENSKSEKEQEYVFVFNNDKAVLKPVTTGIQDNNYIEIKQGLSLGEEVIIGPYKSVSKLLKNKTPVKKVSKDELFENEDSE